MSIDANTNQKFILQYFANVDGVPRTSVTIPIEAPCKETFLANIGRQYTNGDKTISYKNVFNINRKDLEKYAFNLYTIDEWFDVTLRPSCDAVLFVTYTINYIWQNLNNVKSYSYLMSFMPPDMMALKIMDEAHINLDFGTNESSEMIKVLNQFGYNQYSYCDDRNVCDILSLKVKRLGLM